MQAHGHKHVPVMRRTAPHLQLHQEQCSSTCGKISSGEDHTPICLETDHLLCLATAETVEVQSSRNLNFDCLQPECLTQASFMRPLAGMRAAAMMMIQFNRSCQQHNHHQLLQVNGSFIQKLAGGQEEALSVPYHEYSCRNCTRLARSLAAAKECQDVYNCKLTSWPSEQSHSTYSTFVLTRAREDCSIFEAWLHE